MFGVRRLWFHWPHRPTRDVPLPSGPALAEAQLPAAYRAAEGTEQYWYERARHWRRRAVEAEERLRERHPGSK